MLAREVLGEVWAVLVAVAVGVVDEGGDGILVCGGGEQQ